MATPPMATATARTYVEFAPPDSLQEEPGVLALRVDLSGQGFKKEQIRVQIDSFGRLRIRGERPVDADGRQWKRFGKEFEVPDTCDAAGIRARLDKDGVLLITMPKLSAAARAVEPKAPGANTGGAAAAAAGGQGHQPACRRTGAPQAGAAAAEAEGEKPRSSSSSSSSSSSEKGKEEDAGAAAMNSPGRHDDTAAPAARRPAAYGFGKERRRRMLAIFAVMLALVAAGLFARYRLMMDPLAETASSGNHAVVSLFDS